MAKSTIGLALKHRWLVLLLPVVALMATLPLITNGCSCGHDIGFHLQSWLDGAQQLRHGTLYPSWAYSPAYNAGEPRFIFYPPLSWMLGAALASLFPFASVPAIYTWCVLTAAGFSMFAVARRFVAPQAALLASALYLANPYMLFSAFERTAYAELLAAVWIPWIFLAVLRERPRIHAVALPLALVWLTNAPAAVMGSYTLALLGLLRVTAAMRADRLHPDPDRPSARHLAATLTTGAALGLTMPAFYLLPAAYERRFVQITMALVPGLSFPHNFLFGHIGDVGHDYVLHQASLLAVTLLAVTAIIVVVLYGLRRSGRYRDEEISEASTTNPLLSLAVVVALVAFLVEPLSTPIWQHLPELAFLQFPWRFLTILCVTLAFAIAFVANRFHLRWDAMIGCIVAIVAALSFTASHYYHQPCDPQEEPASVAALFHASHGVSATDEYTPNTADNDFLRFDDPGYWLAATPTAFAPGTQPNPNATEPDVDFGEPAPDETVSAQAPHHLVLDLAQPQFLVLNLRDYPNWRVAETHPDSKLVELPAHLRRDDGLIAVALPAGRSDVTVTWVRGWDRAIGLAISACALAVFLLALRQSRRIGL